MKLPLSKSFQKTQHYVYDPRMVSGLVKNKGLPLGAVLVKLCVLLPPPPPIPLAGGLLMGARLGEGRRQEAHRCGGGEVRAVWRKKGALPAGDQDAQENGPTAGLAQGEALGTQPIRAGWGALPHTMPPLLTHPEPNEKMLG